MIYKKRIASLSKAGTSPSRKRISTGHLTGAIANKFRELFVMDGVSGPTMMV